jgi:hypothetical protein
MNEQQKQAEQPACTCGSGPAGGHTRTCTAFDESMMRYDPFGQQPAEEARRIADALLKLDALYREQADEPADRPHWLAAARNDAERLLAAPAEEARGVLPWVSVKDRLPPYDESVLLYRPEAFKTQDPIFHISHRTKWNRGPYEFGCVAEPTHWMALAAPAEEARGVDGLEGVMALADEYAEHAAGAVCATSPEQADRTPYRSALESAISALLAAPAAAEAQPHALQQIGAVLGAGEGARTLGTILASIRNLMHHAACLDAVERTFFMVPGEPDEEDPDEQPSDECMLNRWGSTVEQYMEQFRAAIPHLCAAHSRQPQGEPENPYRAQGSLEEAWKRGFNGERGIAVRGSNYDRVWHEGAAARKEFDAGRQPQGAALTYRFINELFDEFAHHRNASTGTLKKLMDRDDAAQFATSLLARASESRAEGLTDWQLIETAPKDAMVLLAAEFDGPGDWRIKVGYWDNHENDWEIFGGSWSPTHWMPLPAAPDAALAAQKGE